QPHRARKPGGQRDRTHHAERPAAVKTYDPMAGERAAPSAEPRPVGELKRRPRRRRPSNGGKGYGGQKAG
ncbi:MAG: ATP-dependent helicase, partial [Microcystis flos-aquae DF17]